MIDFEKQVSQILRTDPFIISQITGGLGVVFQFPRVEFKPPAIVYFEVNQPDDNFADNTNMSAKCEMQISVLTAQKDKAKEVLICHRIHELLRQYGWQRTYSSSIGESVLGCQHKVMRFSTAQDEA